LTSSATTSAAGDSAPRRPSWSSTLCCCTEDRLVVKTVVAHEALSRHAAVLLRAWRAPRANTKDFLLAIPKLESAVTSPSWRPHTTWRCCIRACPRTPRRTTTGSCASPTQCTTEAGWRIGPGRADRRGLTVVRDARRVVIAIRDHRGGRAWWGSRVLVAVVSDVQAPASGRRGVPPATWCASSISCQRWRWPTPTAPWSSNFTIAALPFGVPCVRCVWAWSRTPLTHGTAATTPPEWLGRPRGRGLMTSTRATPLPAAAVCPIWGLRKEMEEIERERGLSSGSHMS
jgi:hypothetical protein